VFISNKANLKRDREGQREGVMKVMKSVG